MDWGSLPAWDSLNVSAYPDPVKLFFSPCASRLADTPTFARGRPWAGAVDAAVDGAVGAGVGAAGAGAAAWATFRGHDDALRGRLCDGATSTDFAPAYGDLRVRVAQGHG